MPTRPSSSVTAKDLAVNKRQKVSSTSKRHRSGQGIQVKPEHAVAYDGKQMYIQEVMTPAPAQQALRQTSQFSFIVENDAAGLIKDACLRFTIESDADTKLMPVPLWFDRIEWYDRHTGREIARYHGDTMYWLLQTMPKDLLELCGEPVNFNPKTGKESTTIQKAGAANRRYYYLPLPHVWLEGFQLDLSLLRGDLEVKFYPKGDTKVLSTDPAIIDLHEIRWVGNSEMFSQLSRVSFRRSKALATQQHNYIDVQQYTDAGRVLQPSTAFTIDLDQFHHESAFLWVCLRAGATGDNNINALRFQSLGPKATIDHENVHGRSLLGDGTPIDETYFRRMIGPNCFPHEFNNYNAIYCIPFSKDISSVFGGEIDGYHEFRGDRESLRITPDAAPVDSTFTLTAVGTQADADTIVAKYKGLPVSGLVTGATLLSALETLLNDHPLAIEDGVEFKITTADAKLSATAVIAVSVYERGTYHAAELAGQPWVKSKLFFTLEIVTSGGGATGYIPSAYTVGRQGFVGGTYQIDVYSMYYRHIQEHNGRLEVEDM